MFVTVGDHYGERTAPSRAMPSPSLPGNDNPQLTGDLLSFLLAVASLIRNTNQSEGGRGETQYHERTGASMVAEISPPIK